MLRRTYPATMADKVAIAEAINRANARVAARAEAAMSVLMAVVIGIAGAALLVHWWSA